MKAVQSNKKVMPFNKEDEGYWRQHIQSQASTGMSRAKYCRIHHVNYDRLNYWIKRLKAQSASTSSLVAVRVKEEESRSPEMDIMLCQLSLKNGAILSIHNREALLLVLERMM
jgi:hypothetical protein